MKLGISEKKAKEVAKSKDSGKGKKLADTLASLLDSVQTVKGDLDISTDIGKAIFSVAEKLKEAAVTESRNILAKYLLAEGADSILPAPKLNAAIGFMNSNKSFSEDDFKAAAGVGVVVTEQQIKDEIAKIVTANKAKIEELGYNFQGNMIGMTKKVDALKYAAPNDIKQALDKEFEAILGPRTARNTKKTKAKEARQAAGDDVKTSAAASGGAQKGTKANNSAQQSQTDYSKGQQTAAEIEDELAKKRELLTSVALEYDLDVGTVLKKFMGEGGEEEEKEQIINPITVDAGDEAIDYDRLVKKFGTERITDELVARFEKLTGKKAHHLLRRGIFFSHRDLDKALDAYEKGEPFYLYTGRGPSSDSMHIGHLIPFIFTKYLQEAFGCNLVIQMTDDEKYLWKDLTLEQLEHQLRENVRDIIAFGFDRNKTFIFSDFQYMGGKFYENVVKVEKRMTGNQGMKALGLSTLDNIGKFSWSAIQAVPSFSSSFPHMFPPNSDYYCLIPCAIDQDVYFRMTRDIAPRINYKKPAVIHSSFLPAMGGPSSKMSSSTGQEKTIFLTDTADNIKDKVHKYAFSGAPSTLKELKEHGANLDLDVSYQYLRFFLDDDEKLDDLGTKYSKGEITTGAVKDALVETLQKLIKDHQDRRRQTDDAEIKYFMTPDPARFGM